MHAVLDAAKKDDRIKAATFFTTLVDFTDPGELGVFIDEEQLACIEQTMAKRGYLDGAEMATTFNMLRANDLIWSFVINNYLMGKEPFPFDLLYWNSDSTRMPAAMHGFYLRRFYHENRLVQPDGISLDGVPIDLSRDRSPTYWVSTREDHIAPWKSTYAATQMYRSPTKRFVLAGSGHIAGVINPPASGKYGFWTNDELPADPEEFLAKCHPARRLVVGRLGGVERGVLGAARPRPGAGLDGAAGDRGGPRQLCEGSRRLRSIGELDRVLVRQCLRPSRSR